jgi:uncharacterized protein YwgA
MPVSPLQLQRGLFLFQELTKGPLSSFYSFSPYNQGPFDSAIYRDVEALAESGLVVIREAKGRHWQVFSATEKGLQQARIAESELSSRTMNLLGQTMSWIQKQSISKIFRGVPAHFPSAALSRRRQGNQVSVRRKPHGGL